MTSLFVIAVVAFCCFLFPHSVYSQIEFSLSAAPESNLYKYGILRSSFSIHCLSFHRMRMHSPYSHRVVSCSSSCWCHLWGCIERQTHNNHWKYHARYSHTHTHNNSIFNPALLFLFTYMCYAKQSAEVEVECIYSCGVPNINIYLFVWHASMSWRVSELRNREREREAYTNGLCLSNTTFKICFYVWFNCTQSARERERERPETVKFN